MAERYQRVLVGSDGSDRAGRAVDRAAAVARALGASLTILGVGDAGKLTPPLQAQADRNTDGDLSIDVRVESGQPVPTILEVAEDYDLLVLGNKGMSGLERLRLGVVPNKVSHHLPCSLLIVRTG